MIVKPPNKLKQVISNVELVHPKKYPAYWNKCFDCHEKGHFSWAIVCKYSNKQHLTCRVESESDSRGISDVEWYSSDDNPDTESTKIQDENVSPKSGIRQKEIRKISKQPTYHATIVLKENTIPGADISTMSLKCAKSIQFLPTNTKKKGLYASLSMNGVQMHSHVSTHARYLFRCAIVACAKFYISS